MITGSLLALWRDATAGAPCPTRKAPPTGPRDGDRPDCELASDQCVIDGELFSFVAENSR